MRRELSFDYCDCRQHPLSLYFLIVPYTHPCLLSSGSFRLRSLQRCDGSLTLVDVLVLPVNSVEGVVPVVIKLLYQVGLESHTVQVRVPVEKRG
jgi:hypothetical protein